MLGTTFLVTGTTFLIQIKSGTGSPILVFGFEHFQDSDPGLQVQDHSPIKPALQHNLPPLTSAYNDLVCLRVLYWVLYCLPCMPELVLSADLKVFLKVRYRRSGESESSSGNKVVPSLNTSQPGVCIILCNRVIISGKRHYC